MKNDVLNPALHSITHEIRVLRSRYLQLISYCVTLQVNSSRQLDGLDMDIIDVDKMYAPLEICLLRNLSIIEILHGNAAFRYSRRKFELHIADLTAEKLFKKKCCIELCSSGMNFHVYFSMRTWTNGKFLKPMAFDYQRMDNAFLIFAMNINFSHPTIVTYFLNLCRAYNSVSWSNDI